jgi:Flp pilus assembly protein TadD
VLFLLTFALLGVGSGSSGISDALSSAFHFGSGGGTDIAKLERATAAKPKDVKAWRDLATAYEQKTRTADAVAALQQLSLLQPRNANVLQELASQQTTLVNTYSNDASAASSIAGLSASSASFQPPPTTALGKATASLADPIDSAIQQSASTAQSTAQGKLTQAQQAAETTYQKLAALTPKDATAQIQLGQAAQAAGDTATAKSAFTAFLKLAPTDPLAPRVKQVLKSLSGSSTGATSGG